MGIWLEPPFVYVLLIGFLLLLTILCYLEETAVRKLISYVASLAVFGLLVYTGIVIAYWIYGG